MPIHEYACRDCGHGFEMLVRSDTVPACPQCRSAQLHRQLSVFATSSTSATPAAGPAMAAGPCGGCGHPGGPGSCTLQ